MKRLAFIVAWTALVAGCTVGPNYRRPPILTGATPTPHLKSGQDVAYRALAPLPPRWWRLYDNSVLDALEEKALTRNTDLRAALASLEQARASLRSTELQRTPQTSLTVDPTYGQASGDANGSPVALKPAAVYDALESISYDLGLFGRP